MPASMVHVHRASVFSAVLSGPYSSARRNASSRAVIVPRPLLGDAGGEHVEGGLGDAVHSEGVLQLLVPEGQGLEGTHPERGGGEGEGLAEVARVREHDPVARGARYLLLIRSTTPVTNTVTAASPIAAWS